MKKLFITLAGAAALISSTAWSQVVVRVGPPRVIVERPVPRPGPRYVWLPGYYRWGGVRYVWVPGKYEIPPRPGVVWVAPRWVQRNGSWVFVEGFWR
ncbi:MAG: YXWGXW repeat-containing protein [Acidobacteriales bacterium]|nr:YXWGXW repeat-containing protein [Terriglobales bacterium]